MEDIDWDAEFYAVNKHLEEFMINVRKVDRVEFFSAMITYAQKEILETYKEVKDSGKVNCDNCLKLSGYDTELKAIRSHVDTMLKEI